MRRYQAGSQIGANDQRLAAMGADSSRDGNSLQLASRSLDHGRARACNRVCQEHIHEVDIGREARRTYTEKWREQVFREKAGDAEVARVGNRIGNVVDRNARAIDIAGIKGDATGQLRRVLDSNRTIGKIDTWRREIRVARTGIASDLTEKVVEASFDDGVARRAHATVAVGLHADILENDAHRTVVA